MLLSRRLGRPSGICIDSLRHLVAIDARQLECLVDVFPPTHPDVSLV